VKRLVVSAQTEALDDWEHDEAGDLIAPGGKSVAQWLAQELDAHGEVKQHSHYGWQFEASHLDETIWCMIALGAGENEAYFWAERRANLVQRLIGRAGAAHEPTLDRIAALLTEDVRFDDVKIVPPGA